MSLVLINLTDCFFSGDCPLVWDVSIICVCCVLVHMNKVDMPQEYMQHKNEHLVLAGPRWGPAH